MFAVRALGSCCSSEGTYFRPSEVETVQNELDTGDIVWLSGKGTQKFMLKAGAWRMFNRVGVLVFYMQLTTLPTYQRLTTDSLQLRVGPGLDNLQLCVAQGTHDGIDDSNDMSSDAVQICNFSDEFRSGAYKSVAVTKTTAHLTPEEQQLVFDFCNKSMGASRNQKVALWISPDKKVFCNQLVAEMLVSCGRVTFVDNLYCPARNAPPSLLQPALFLAVQQNPCLSARTMDASFSLHSKGRRSPHDSVAEIQSTRSTVKSPVSTSEQNEVFYSIRSMASEDAPQDTVVHSQHDGDQQKRLCTTSSSGVLGALAGGACPAGQGKGSVLSVFWNPLKRQNPQVLA